MAHALPPAIVASSPTLGTAEGRCRPDETGPAIVITARGLKDRSGDLRAEVYPDTTADFLKDDNILLSEGKTFRRAVASVPAAGPATLCVRLPAAGSYTLALVHRRTGQRQFTLRTDGIGFPGDPRLGWSKPPAAAARFVAGPGITHLTIALNYWRGFGFSRQTEPAQ